MLDGTITPQVAFERHHSGAIELRRRLSIDDYGLVDQKLILLIKIWKDSLESNMYIL